MEPSELAVSVYGDTAILTGKLTFTMAGAVQLGASGRCSSAGGHWFLVSLQGVPLSDPN